MEIKLPPPIIIGTTSARTIIDVMRPRGSKYEELFYPGQESLGSYYLAPFQRPPVWDDTQSRRLVESVWLGISIGSIVISGTGAFNRKLQKYPHTSEWIIDGQQRMRALSRYLSNELRIFVGQPGAHFWDELNPIQQRRFKHATVGFIVLESMSEDALRECYNRLNFGGTSHLKSQRA